MNTTRPASLDRGSVWRATLVVAAVAVMVGLGTWQVQRLQWKTGLIADREAALALPPVDLSGNPDELRTASFRRVRAHGVFLHDKEIVLGPRTYNGAAGWHVITPLRFPGGATVLVNRGWVPYARREPATRPVSQPSGPVRVAGLIRAVSPPGTFTPDNEPGKGDWYYLDIPALAKHLGIRSLPVYTIDAGSAPNPGGYPIGGQTIIRPVNRHLEYAVTWYGLAVVLLVIYVIDLRRRRRDREEEL